MTTPPADTPLVQSALAVLDPETTAAKAQPAPETAAALPRGPIHPTVLPVALVALDIEVREKYLSSDIEAICAIAGKTGSAVLIANAGHPLENREHAFQIWRKRGLEDLAKSCPGLWEFLSDHTELCAEFEAATVDLLHLDRLMREDREAKIQHRLDRRSAEKEALRAALDKNCDEDSKARIPSLLVIRGDGEMKLLKSSPKAKQWGAEGNLGFYLIPLSLADFRLFMPEE